MSLSLLLCPSLQRGPALQEFVEWTDNQLELKVSKTKDMVVTFSSLWRTLAEATTSIIHGEPIDIVSE